LQAQGSDAGALSERIDALLPQTQCGRCGYAGCRPYADALANAGAAINRCPPGGTALVAALAALLGRPALPLDPECGPSLPDAVASIESEACIGCARCLPACPVDAILGAARYLHTIITAECTGCALCLPTCPVDCIEMRPRVAGEAAPSGPDNRIRHARHLRREAQQQAGQAQLLAERKRAARGQWPE
jgi:H+/Na+-translocating ferredoxin:NAD+ oxidoreductase subunit B